MSDNDKANVQEVPTNSNSNQSNSEQTMINIRDLPRWLTEKVKSGEDNASLLLRPSSLRTLYQLFFYEHMRWRLAQAATEAKGDEKKEVEVPEKDEDVNLPEQLVVVLVQVFFNEKCFNFFNSLYHL